MKKSVALVAAGALALAACTTDPYTGERKASKAGIGAGVGAAVGALGGALIGGGDTRTRVLIGAGVGALAGAGVGYYMDRQEAKLRDRLQSTGVSVTRQGDNIILNMPSNITFGVDQSDIRPNFYEVLNSVAIVLDEFDKTLVDVMGHTDSTGSAEYNIDLSLRRASSVGQYLVSQGVDGRRLLVKGFGEERPIADNSTEAGRAANRRVEIQISPLRATSSVAQGNTAS
ncbi:OmpA family protein [Pyruvatibacter mobilis]|uniref:OmpA family protein n=1 Tax=Pyruvatibacter mobilis TaxID=1712261 RepID=UPI003BAA90CE